MSFLKHFLQVCKYFIEAVENKTYGWFWGCPNGDKCMYRHALPPGFTLKSEMKKKDAEDEISLEMLVEKERASLGAGVTKVTLETFLAWKARKLTEKKDEKTRQEAKKQNDFKLGFHNGLTGRDLFTFNPDLIANDDDNAQNDIDYRRRDEYEDDESAQQFVARDINLDFFAKEAREADGTGTVATDDRFSYLDSMIKQENENSRIRSKLICLTRFFFYNFIKIKQNHDYIHLFLLKTFLRRTGSTSSGGMWRRA